MREKKLDRDRSPIRVIDPTEPTPAPATKAPDLTSCPNHANQTSARPSLGPNSAPAIAVKVVPVRVVATMFQPSRMKRMFRSYF